MRALRLCTDPDGSTVLMISVAHLLIILPIQLVQVNY